MWVSNSCHATGRHSHSRTPVKITKCRTCCPRTQNISSLEYQVNRAVRLSSLNSTETRPVSQSTLPDTLRHSFQRKRPAAPRHAIEQARIAREKWTPPSIPPCPSVQSDASSRADSDDDPVLARNRRRMENRRPATRHKSLTIKTLRPNLCG